jgi:hypothetical protein
MYTDVYHRNVKRTQLYLEERQRKILEDQSRVTGKSVGQLIREAVDRSYSSVRERTLGKNAPLWDYVGAGRGKESDVSRRHDDYLYGDEE